MCLLLFTVGCDDNSESAATSSPYIVAETSASIPELADHIKLLEIIVTIRRSYDDLEYKLTVKDNSGGRVRGPTDWDVRIIARVPPDELGDWAIAGGRDDAMTTPDWIADTAGAIDVSSITESYSESGRKIGIDRINNVIAYQAFTN